MKKKSKWLLVLVMLICVLFIHVINGYKVSSVGCDKNNMDTSDAIDSMKDEFEDIGQAIGVPESGQAIFDLNDLMNMLDRYANPIEDFFSEIPDSKATGVQVYKPNIYIYSNEDMNINIRVFPQDLMTLSQPLYNPYIGWEAKVLNGSLNGSNDYLFYEALVPDKNFQMEYGFLIKGVELEKAMVDMLDVYGFNETEKRDFVEFWVPMLLETKHWVFYPQDKRIVDSIIDLIIEPKPEVGKEFRLWFYILEDRGQSFESEFDVVPIVRDGYYIIEWGGIVDEH